MGIKLTNKYGAPEELVRAASYDDHVTKGDISTTTLIDAPQIRYLKMTNDIEEDVSDRIWMLFGTAVHHILERSELGSHKARTLLEAAEIFRESGNEKVLPF